MATHDLEDVSYDRDEAVAAFTDFFDFLVKMYLNPSDVKLPPEGGWPSVTDDRVSKIGKSQSVGDLLRHLPYVDDSSVEHDPCVFPCGHFFMWPRHFSSPAMQSDEPQGIREFTEEKEYMDSTPEDVVGLALSGEDGETVMLDTKLGVVYWVTCPNEIKYVDGKFGSDVNGIDDDPYDWAPLKEAEWREKSGVWTIPDFFAMLKQQYLDLAFVPVGPCVVHYALTRYDGMGDALSKAQEIYREHGWPDLDVYRKRDCLLAIRDMFKAHDSPWDDGQMPE